MTAGEMLRATEAYLARKGIDTPRLDAELLLARALDLSRIELYTQHDRPVTGEERAKARVAVERRGAREPLAYVLGDWGFRRLTLKTDARALVPRPETEIVVERCLALLEGTTVPRVLDVGTGSGAIALALADERTDAKVTATDISADALSLARENAAALGLDVTFGEASIVEGLDETFALVVSNPPYVLDGELPDLEPEVRDWEPRLALIDDGQTEALLEDARRVLDGWLVLEVHEHRAAAIATRLAELGYAEIAITRDLAGRERVLEARWRQTTTPSA